MSDASAAVYSRKNPFPAKFKSIRTLTGQQSEKDTRHIELDIEGSGFIYEPGDSLGVFPTNDPELVEEILSVLDFSGEEMVPDSDGNPLPVRTALLKNFIITEPSKQLLLACADKDSSAVFLKDLLDPLFKSELDSYLWGRGVIDPLLEFDAARFVPEEFVKLLRKLQPRLYSIACSRKVCPGEVHLTVGCVRYETFGRNRKGVASTFLADRVPDVESVPVFVHSAKHFRIPENPDVPAIMVGPGTGIAPFRGFLQERQATQAKGKNWIFFGEQRSRGDFFYQEDLEAWKADGTLTRLDTAFSRDQDFKIYVQHRMAENSAELFAWLEEGAAFYVCGDARRMATDVDTTLHEIIAKEGKLTHEGATEYVTKLKHEKRYRRDVY